MPTPRSEWSNGLVAVDGKLYAIGGAVFGAAGGRVEEYDPKTDIWTVKGPMRTPRYRSLNVTPNGKIYVIGGRLAADGRAGDFVSNVEEYDPATNTWTERKPWQSPRAYASACTLDGKIYVMGGLLVIDGKETTIAGDVEEYDPIADTWTPKAPMPTPRCFLASVVVGGKLYAISGSTIEGRSEIVEIFDPLTNTWEKGPDLNVPRDNFDACVVEGKIYVIGGMTNGATILTSVEELDTGLRDAESRAIPPSGKLPSRWGEWKAN